VSTSNCTGFQWEDQPHRFRLYRQPIESLSGKETVDASYYEILLRICNDDGQALPPASVLQCCEQLGIVDRVDTWVINTLLQYIEETGDTNRYAVNLSGDAMNSEEFLLFLEEKVGKSFRGQSDRITFEITESVAIKDEINFGHFLFGFKKMTSCRILLDDFGAGHSSLRRLRMLPVDGVKIDGSFISDIVEDDFVYQIVRSIVNLCRHKGLVTVAENIENENILRKVTELGIDYGQGYYIGKPAPLP
jgi:EAL domain-containing protein (putative c-di-GMP-specific phosphodiesterase class I)